MDQSTELIFKSRTVKIQMKWPQFKCDAMNKAADDLSVCLSCLFRP